MNNTFFNPNLNSSIPINNVPTNNVPTNKVNIPMSNYADNLPLEQSYIENILRLNKGKQVTIHMTFPDSEQFKDREFIGIIEQSGRDHIILSDPTTGKWYLLLMIYVDFITFDEKINYSQEFIPNM